MRAELAEEFPEREIRVCDADVSLQEQRLEVFDWIADLDVEFELGQACGRGIQPVFGLETRCAPDADAGERRFEPRSVPSSGLPQGALEQLRAGELKVRLSRAAV